MKTYTVEVTTKIKVKAENESQVRLAMQEMDYNFIYADPVAEIVDTEIIAYQVKRG